MTDLPAILREWRGNMTQAAAASHLGVSLRTYQGWEVARRMPSDTTISLLIRAINGETEGLERAAFIARDWIEKQPDGERYKDEIYNHIIEQAKKIKKINNL